MKLNKLVFFVLIISLSQQAFSQRWLRSASRASTHISPSKITPPKKAFGDYTIGEVKKMNTPRPGENFTKSQKEFKKSMSEHYNNGRLIDDNTYEELQNGKKHTKGVRPPDNEAHADHTYPKSKGGSGSLDNMTLTSRKNNLAKSDKVTVPNKKGNEPRSADKVEFGVSIDLNSEENKNR